MKAILRAARLAPSSFNSQPWRFVVYSDRIYIFAKKTLPFSGKEKRAFKEFNIGIMLSHIMLAAEELWMNMETQVEDQFAKKDYKMRTRAKMKVVAGDRARRENVPRHIPFCLADELNIITMQKKTSVTIFEKSLQNAEIFSEPIFLLETEKLLC